MAEKPAESTWSAFKKKLKLELDDGPLLKALARFEKTDEAKPQPRLEALGELDVTIQRQVVALARRKKELGDKVFDEVKAKLYEMQGRVEVLLKETRAAAAGGGEDEEADSPALLSKKMTPLLRELRKGEARMHAMICTAGKATAVLIMRRAISPSRFKLLTEHVDAAGGAKKIVGECQYEKGALTFVVPTAAGGLARRLRQALLDQTELRLKVRVRGEDGAQDEDGEEEAEAATATADSGGAPTAPPAPSPERLAYVQRLRKVRERLQQALREQHPESTRLRALIGIASDKADAQHDYAGATLALRGIEKLLDAPVGGSAAGEAKPLSNDARKALGDRLLAVATAARSAIGRDASLREQLLPAITAAKTALDGGDEARCLALLAALEKRLGTGGRPGAPGLVGKRSFILTRWRNIPSEIAPEIAALSDAVASELPHEDAAGFARALERSLGELTGSMQARIDAAIDTAINTGDPGYGAVKAAVAAVRIEVEGNPLLVLLRKNALASTVGVDRAYATALSEIEQALAA